MLSRTPVPLPSPQAAAGTPRTFSARTLLASLPLLILAYLALFAPSALAAGDANRAQCHENEKGEAIGTESSPGFRTYLPDCRAFELVTPPYAGGDLPSGVARVEFPMSANGDHLIGQIFSGFAETENLEENSIAFGAVYEFSRSPGGWSTESLEPPASQYPRRRFDLASSDLSRSLWELEKPLADGEELPIAPPEGVEVTNNSLLAVREPASSGKAGFAIVGPIAAPGHEPSNAIFPLNGGYNIPEVAGASAGLGHVLLGVPVEGKQAWPGDETLANDHSLYEYAGLGEAEPVLVGVSNEGSVVDAARSGGRVHVNEAAVLISRCGTLPGGTELGGSARNDISGSGEVVFFTALACGGEPQVNELYARVGGSSTVAISEPSHVDCAACDITKAAQEAAPAGAVFQGASEDGSKVFFTTEQELLPGASGNNLYMYNLSGPEASLANPDGRLTLLSGGAGTPELQGIYAVSQDGTRVYFQAGGVLTNEANGNGEKAQPAASNLYVYDTETGHIAFVAEEVGLVDVSSDGRFALLQSSRHIHDTNDTAPVAQLFEYDANSGLIARVSVGQIASPGYECPATHVVEAAFNCDGNTATEAPLATEVNNHSAKLFPPTEAASNLSLAGDGTVVFESRDALTPRAVAGGANVYEYRAGDVFLVAPGDEAVPVEAADEPREARLRGISETGEDVFFASDDSLVPQDSDTQTSWYDAREDGGLPAPVSTVPCQGSTCQNPSPPPPSFSSPLTPPTTNENLAEPKPVPSTKPKPKKKVQKCAKGKVRKNGTCVPRPKSKKAKKSDRRASR